MWVDAAKTGPSQEVMKLEEKSKSPRLKRFFKDVTYKPPKETGLINPQFEKYPVQFYFKHMTSLHVKMDQIKVHEPPNSEWSASAGHSG